LVKGLKPGQVVVLDNLSAHQVDRVRQAIEASGSQVLFLPAYSPDCAPIQEAFSRLKTWLRWLGARKREALEEAIAEAHEQVTVQEARGWSGHGGDLSQNPGKQRADAVPACWLNSSAHRSTC
jgi:transposase